MKISPELIAIGLVIEQALSPSIPWKMTLNVSPENVLRILIQNRISLAYLSDNAIDANTWLKTAPDYENELLKQVQLRDRAYSNYREFDSLLKQKGIDNLLIKSVGFFPPETSNIDVLVRHQNLAQARESLLELGYIHHKRYLRPDKFLFPRFLGGVRDSLIHLHTRVSWGPPFLDEQRIWDCCQPNIDGDLQPSVEQAFMITLAHNFYEDSEFDLWDLTKLRLCRPFELDWDEIFRETKRWGWDNGMALSILVLDQVHEALFEEQKLVPETVLLDLKKGISNLDGTRQNWVRWSKRSILVSPMVFPKVFTKAHAYLTSIRSQPTPWRLKLRDMRLLSRWACETLFGIRARRSFFVAFSGPDGSGKTTLADTLIQTINSTDEHPIGVWIRIGDSPFLNPIKKLVRPNLKLERQGDKRIELISGGLWRSTWLWISIIDWGVRVFFKIQIPLWRNRLIICDRYILDALVDLSNRVTWDYVNKSNLVKILLRFAPVPNITFNCITPANILLQRRPDDLTKQTAKQLEMDYIKRRSALTNIIEIDTSQDEIQIKTTVVHKVIEDYYAQYEIH